MKKRAVLAAIAASLALATPAVAGSSSVMRGLQDGSLTSAEVYELVTFQAEVDTLEKKIRSDGRVTQNESSYLDELSMELEQRLEQFSNNHLRRWTERPDGW